MKSMKRVCNSIVCEPLCKECNSVLTLYYSSKNVSSCFQREISLLLPAELARRIVNVNMSESDSLKAILFLLQYPIFAEWTLPPLSFRLVYFEFKLRRHFFIYISECLLKVNSQKKKKKKKKKKGCIGYLQFTVNSR